MRNRCYYLGHGLHCVMRIATAVAMLFAVAQASAATQYTHQVLHGFCDWYNCNDGYLPNSLLRDASGHLYGTTWGSGKNDYGVVFELVPNHDKSKYTETVLYNFCSEANCADGALPGWPLSDLIIDSGGNLYGTTSRGGKYHSGVIFVLVHTRNSWSYSVLHNFCKDCSGGSNPEMGLSYAGQWQGKPWNESSPLFGTTSKGGSGNGVIYELTVNPTYHYQVIHTLQSGTGPQPVLVDPGGNLFVADNGGGRYGGGVLFKLDANTWSETTLHDFCDQANCTDGQYPTGRLLLDAAGNIYLTTEWGGVAGGCGGGGCGVVFERPSGGGFKVLYNFCSLRNCVDGGLPTAGLAMDGSGNLFGTAPNGGAVTDAGVVFELSPGGVETVLFKFCVNGGHCAGGETPYTPVILDSAGNIFGTTNFGGDHGLGDAGTAFVLKP